MSSLQVTVIGTGYVGLVQGVVLSSFGHHVTCLDLDTAKIAQLNAGICPIYEPGLNTLLAEQLQSGRLLFTSDTQAACRTANLFFIAVGTPSGDDGSADLAAVLTVAKSIGEHITDHAVVVTKSTVPIGTGQKIRETIKKTLAQRNSPVSFEIASNPEFLREGKALDDCLNPDRIVIGCESVATQTLLTELYYPLHAKGIPFLYTSIESAEMIKYSANAFLAVKISFINELSLLAEKTGANIIDVAKGMGMDKRIGADFLACGPGYGGSCFPKDTLALRHIADTHDESLAIVEAAITANAKQKNRVARKIIDTFHGNAHDKKIGILGLSFKADTDDVRAAPVLDIAPLLVRAGARLRVFCPKGMPEAKWRLAPYSQAITYTDTALSCAENCDALVIMTDWSEFKTLPLAALASTMKTPILLDFRHVYVHHPDIRQYFVYYALGIGDSHPQ